MGRFLSTILLGASGAAVLLLASGPLTAAVESKAGAQASAKTCAGDNGGITLPKGFCATVFADNIGHARQMAVARTARCTSTRGAASTTATTRRPQGGFLVALQDTKGDGKADHVERFGDRRSRKAARAAPASTFYKDWLYAELNDKIVRYALPKTARSRRRASRRSSSRGMPLTGDHPMHPFVIDKDGNLFVDLGSATNTCQVKNRMPGSPGHDLHRARDARRHLALRRQQDRPAVLAEGALRHGHPQRRGLRLRRRRLGLYATQHGRDQLHENWPKLYTAGAGRQPAGRGAAAAQEGRRLRLAEVLLRLTSRSWCWRRSTAATAARRSAMCAEKQGRRSPRSPPTGRPTIS